MDDAHVAEMDQARAGIRDAARLVASYYAGLLEGDVEWWVAMQLAKSYASQLLFREHEDDDLGGD